MKKPAILFITAAICITLTACGGRMNIPDVTPAPLQTETPAIQTPPPTEAPTPAPSATPAPASTPAPTAAPASKPQIKITKSPTGETVDEGGKAVFIAKADNADGIVWITVSPDAKTYYEVDKCPKDFEPLKVQGQGTEKIVLTEIPYAMNGWRIQCYFTGNGGPAYTNGAILKVNKADSPEAKAKSLAEDYRSVVRKYADYSHWTLGKVENFKFYSEQTYGEYQLTLTRGAINLVCTLDTYPKDGTCYPVGLDWYENGKTDLVKSYIFGSYDSESWNHFEKTVLDITDYYGDGTAGQGMQFNNGN